MGNETLCEHCGAVVPTDSDGLCLDCLLKLAEPVAQEPTNQKIDFALPEPESLISIFPNMEGFELIGWGGMGAVYKAWQPNLERAVAIKLLPTEMAAHPEFESRFAQEARAMARLEHDHIVRIYEYGRKGDLYFLILEYVQGADLARVLDSGKKLTLTEKLSILSQLCEAVQYAHDRKIIHRDIKPANVLLTQDGRIKVTDFGLATALEGESDRFKLTGTNTAVGTVQFMAPEILDGQSGDHRSDIYSVGVVAYRLLTNSNPAGEFPPPSATAGVPKQLDPIITRALDRDPAKRFQDATSLRRALRQVQQQLKPGGNQTLVVFFAEIVAKTADSTQRAQTMLEGARRLGEHLTKVIDEVDGAVVINEDEGCFLISATAPSLAVALALRLQEAASRHQAAEVLSVRMALHLGEVTESLDEETGDPSLSGYAVSVAAAMRDLAVPGQILISEAIFNNARPVLKKHPSHGTGSRKEPAEIPLQWPAHGRYHFQNLDDTVSVFEVGIEGRAPLTPPENTGQAQRDVSIEEEATLGWRPAAGIPLKDRPNWILKEKLGQGGFGEVWMGEHVKTRDKRVFKFCFNAVQLRALKRELTLFRFFRDSLGRRPDMVTIHDIQVDQAPYYLESEYFPDGNLAMWADKEGGIDEVSVETRLQLMQGISKAMGAAHSVGIIHKDLKPTNILIEKTEKGIQPRLADFGLGEVDEKEKLRDLGITEFGFSEAPDTEQPDSGFSGTRLYTAPEYLVGAPPSAKGDVYALGVMLYQMAIGNLRRPLATGWEREIKDALLAEDIAKCVDIDPENRFEDASELFQSLNLLEERRRSARLAHTQRCWRKGLFATLGVASVVAIALGYGWWTSQDALQKAREAHEQAKESLAAEEKAKKQAQELLVKTEAANRRSEEANERGRLLVSMMMHHTYPYLGNSGDDRAKADLVAKLDHYFNSIPTEEMTDGLRIAQSKLLHRKALLKLDGGSTSEGIELLRKVVEMRKALGEGADPDPHHYDLMSNACDQLGKYLGSTGDFQAAIPLLAEAEAFGELAKERTTERGDLPEVENGQCNILVNRAQLDVHVGEYDHAAHHFEQAIGTRLDLISRVNKDETYRRSICWTYYHHSLLEKRRSRINQALASIESGKVFAKGLMQEFPKKSDYPHALAGLSYAEGLILQQQGLAREAHESFEHSARFYDQPRFKRQWAAVKWSQGWNRLLEKGLEQPPVEFEEAYRELEPEFKPDTRDLRLRLDFRRTTLDRLRAEIVFADEIPNNVALELEKVTQAAAKIAAETPASLRAQSLLAQCHVVKAQALAQDSDAWSQAQEAAARAITLLEPVCQKVKNLDSEFVLSLAEALCRAGEIAMALGDTQVSTDQFKTAAVLLEKMDAAIHQNVKRVRLLAAARAGLTHDTQADWPGVSSFLYHLAE